MQIELPPKPSPEQLTILRRPLRPVEIIKGAAGSGKTLTALYKLVFALGYMSSQKKQINVLVLSYNRTLKGYISALIEAASFPPMPQETQVNLQVDTFARWAMDLCDIRDFRPCKFSDFINREHKNLPLELKYSADFIEKEITYILKRFPHDNFSPYITARRYGRGNGKPIEVNSRELLIKEYIEKYCCWKRENSRLDWEDIAWKANNVAEKKYEIIVVDEGQDFTANQYRALVKSLANDSTLICVIDTAQKIYLNGFTWNECGIDARKYQPVTLSANFRNTREISALAAKVLDGVSLDEDGILPQSQPSMRTGAVPVLLQGKFSHQMDYIIPLIKKHLASHESCAILLKKDTWSSALRSRLKNAGLNFASITRDENWPDEEINLVISTMHSAKGLEFDHVFMPGICAEGFPQYDGEDEENEHQDRRLLAMAIGRGKKTVTLGEKPGEESPYFSPIESALLEKVLV